MGFEYNRRPAEQQQQRDNITTMIKRGIYAAVALIGLATVLGSFYTIDSGEVGVVQRFGKFSDSVSLPGLHWKFPFTDSVVVQDVKLQTANYAGTSDEEDADGIVYKPHLDVLDAKNVSYDIELTLLYTPQAEKMPFILSTYGQNYFDKKINPIVRDVVRDVGGNYNVETIADHRDAINTQIKERLVAEFKGLPFTFEDATLRKVQLPAKIMEKIQQVQEAKQEESRLMIVNRQAEQNKAITITNAEAAKSKVVIEAQAEAEAILTRANAQAKANERINASLTGLLVEQNKVERWDGAMPQIVGSGAGLLIQMPQRTTATATAKE